jgi:predicted metalloprotease with PDZ domain
MCWAIKNLNNNQFMRQFFFLQFILLPLWSLAQFLPAQRDDEYQVEVVPTAEKYARVYVVPPLQSLDADSVIFALPRVVPGTYSISSFGRFVDSLSVIDQHIESLEVIRLDDNRWYIPNGKDVYRISYRVNETLSRPAANIFEPSGTAFREGFFWMNYFGIVGYILQADDLPFELTVQRPLNFYAAGNLPVKETNFGDDVFTAPITSFCTTTHICTLFLITKA